MIRDQNWKAVQEARSQVCNHMMFRTEKTTKWKNACGFNFNHQHHHCHEISQFPDHLPNKEGATHLKDTLKRSCVQFPTVHTQEGSHTLLPSFHHSTLMASIIPLEDFHHCFRVASIPVSPLFHFCLIHVSPLFHTCFIPGFTSVSSPSLILPHTL